MMTLFHNRVQKPASRTTMQRSTRRRAFTLVEVMVALAIMMILLVVVLVPLNLGLEMTQVGRARAQVQVAAQATLSQMERELRRAVYVFPNTEIPDITDRAPYDRNNGRPYIELTDDAAISLFSTFTDGVCDTSGATAASVNNTSRIDFLLPKTTNGVVQTPLENESYLVSYYPRRLYTNINPLQYYDEVENPIVLFRAQIPYRAKDGTALDIGSSTQTAVDDLEPITNPAQARNADVSGNRYPVACGGPDAENRGSRWLTQNTFSEPDLEPLTKSTLNSVSPSVVGSHTLLTPRGMALVAPFADAVADDERNFQPTSSFTLDDTNGDRKIDRVTIYLELSQFDAGGASAKAQRVRVPLTVDLPNIR